MSKRPDSLKSLAKAMPLICRVATETTRTLRAVNGEPITDELRDQLLAKCAAGEHVEIEVDILAYEQRPGVANRNFLRFRDGAMLKLGASGKGTPFLKNHDQGDVEARGGTITRSLTEKVGEGEYHVRQTARISAPWAVSMALRGLLDKVSIGWAGDDVTCSACGTAVYTECYHWPGDRVSEEAGADGKKRYVRDRKGNLRVEWIFNDPSLVETSAVNVPAVPMAGIEAVRAALAAVMPDHAEGDGLFAPPHEDPEVAALSARPQPSPSAEPKEREMSAKTAPSTDTTDPISPETQAKIDAQVKKLRADERLLTELCAKHGLKVDVPKLLEEHKTLEAARIEVLRLLTEREDAKEPIRGEHRAEVGTEASEKKRDLIEQALLAKMSGAKPKDKEVERYSRMSLMAIGDELFEDAGVTSRQLRGIDPADRAKLMLGMRLPIGVQRKLAGPGMNSTSDFPLIIGSVLNTRMRQLYELRTQLWKVLAIKENLPDFNSFPTYGGGRFPKLLDVKEGGVYQRGSFQMSESSVRLGKAGRIVSVTWELLLADRIGLIERAISDRADAVLRWEDVLFYKCLILNLLADGTTPIWDTENTATGGAISVSTLGSGFVKMATRTTPDGEDPVVGPDEDGDPVIVNVANALPKYWLTPALQGVNAESLLGDGYVPTAASAAPTRAMRALEVIPDGNLDANGVTASFLFADPARMPVFQFGHLQSEDGPVLEEEDGFTVDGKDFKVRATGYVAAVDNIGTVKMPIS